MTKIYFLKDEILLKFIYHAYFKRDVTCFVVADSCNDKGINSFGDDTCSPSSIESSG